MPRLPSRHLLYQTPTSTSKFTFIPLHLIQSRTLTYLPRSKFSTQQKPSSSDQNPSFGAASFKELGANRTVKTVIIVFLSIAATVETVGWIKFFGWKVWPEGKGGKDGEGKA